MLLEFIYSGDKKWIYSADKILADIKELSLLNRDPFIWWIARFLIIILSELNKASLWNLTKQLDNIDAIDKVKNYILGLSFRKTPVIELFISQRKSLEKIFKSDSAVVSMPTSSGKTRIAEIAMMQSLINHPDSLVLYIAPFKSLAFEIEEALSQSLGHMNYQISHLYGGAQFTKIDKNIIEESQIIVATPEKAKAIIRSDRSIINKINLIIIDEGHLIGDDPRQIFNELFIEELKIYIQRNNGKIIVLSAVLPNAGEISKWITKNENQVAESDWRPSPLRLGILKWDGKNVHMYWEEKFETFNRNFIKPFFINKDLKKQFPSNKQEAIAAAALKLSKLGSVLVFVGKANMVNGCAEKVLFSMGPGANLHNWKNKNDWDAFELACEEAYGSNSDILNYAKYGIICHNNQLTSDVRFATEKLMKYGDPSIIIATSTLGQGVNIGVSSVIIGNVWINENKKISTGEFWNIAGRAGRAFADSEGKVLFAIDISSDKKHIREREERLASSYLNGKTEYVHSGLLAQILKINGIANKCKIDFELLLQLIAENDLSKFIDSQGKDFKPELEEIFDYIDDTLLSINLDLKTFNDDVRNIENYFRESLSYIQAEKISHEYANDVFLFLKARNAGVLKVAKEHTNWESLVASSIPLRTGLFIKEKIQDILEIINLYKNSEKNIDDLTLLFQNIENLIREFPSLIFRSNFGEEKLKIFRRLWLQGTSVKEINDTAVFKKNEINKLISFFSYQIPWVINGIAKTLYNLGYQEEANIIERTATFSELGLPNVLAVKIYLAGIKSRKSAAELSGLSDLISDLPEDIGISKLRKFIIDKIDILGKCSDYTTKWIKILAEYNNSKKYEPKEIKKINFDKDIFSDSEILYLRAYNNEIFFCNPDYTEKIKIEDKNSFDDKIVDNLGVFFEYDSSLQSWGMKIRNPYIIFK